MTEECKDCGDSVAWGSGKSFTCGEWVFYMR